MALASIVPLIRASPKTARITGLSPVRRSCESPLKLNVLITSKAAYDRLGAVEADKLAIGTGPYKFKEWVSGQRFVLEKNPKGERGWMERWCDSVWWMAMV